MGGNRLGRSMAAAAVNSWKKTTATVIPVMAEAAISDLQVPPKREERKR